MILDNLDGVETGIRQLIREQPLDTVQIQIGDGELTVPTLSEILRIKAVLILKRNATRDYLDFIALADAMGDDAFVIESNTSNATKYPTRGEKRSDLRPR